MNMLNVLQGYLFILDPWKLKSMISDPSNSVKAFRGVL